MASPEHLDSLIGEALECANEAAREIRKLPLEPTDKYIKKVGAAILELWEIREQLYKVHPNVKRDFVAESEVDEVRFNALTALHNEALAAEAAGRKEEALALFHRLKGESKFGFFKLCAEAGLYRNARRTA